VSAPVLAAYDPVARDRAPVRFGALVAGFTGAPLMVASAYAGEDVVDPLAGGQMGEVLPGDPGEALGEVVRDLEGVDVDTVALGATSAPRALSLAAVEAGAGLLVTGSAQDAPAGRLSPGPTAQRLLNGTPCAVAVVPGGWEPRVPLSVFGAGFADTTDGHAAVEAAHALGDRAGVPLRVLTAVRPRPWMGAGADDDLQRRAEDAAPAAVPDAPGVAVDIDVVVGDPAELLVGVSGELDLLVCGSRSYGPRPATLLGGVTRRVTAEAACPVIVLARGAEVGLEALLAEPGT
jgi:nucleotide-binding universal stress UspA family protein